MTDNNSSSGLSACSIVCWLLAFAFGIFIAAALIGWTGMHGLLAAVLGLIAMLIAGWILKGMFCADDASSSVSSTTTAAAAVGAGAVATSAAAASSTAKAPAAKKPAAKKTATKSTSTAKTKTVAAKPAAAKKPAAKKTAAKSTSTAKTKTAAAKKSTAKAAAKPAAAKKPAAKKAAPTKFYRKAPAKVDDLKLISGVGPKLEKTLNDIGIYKYEQVAAWKKADIKKVDDQLKFKGRIERDDWMKQAKVLAKGGDTEFSKKKRKS